MLGAVLLALSLRAPAADTTLRDIPSIMRAKGWTRGAFAMDAWFRRKARVARDEAQGVDFDLPTIDVPGLDMAYTLTCPRARAKFDALTSAALWSSPSVAAELQAKYRSLLATLKPGTKAAFGGKFKLSEVGGKLKAFHEQRVESASVSTLATLSVPDLFATLGGFSYYAIPKGAATLSPDGRTVTFEITDLGLYVIDCYRWHTESRPFGWWKKPDVVSYVEPEAPKGYVSASDGAFNEYRNATGYGGDYLIFLPPAPFHFKEPVKVVAPFAG